MVSNRLRLALMMLAFCASFYPTASGGNGMEQMLAVSVTVSKGHVTVGDRITISGVIKNIASGRIYVEARPRAYSILHVRMSDSQGKPLKGFRKVLFDLKPPAADDFVELKPGDEITMSFNATLRQEKILDIEKGERHFVEGLFLDFENSAILLPGKGKYELAFQIEGGKQYSEEVGRQFGFRSVWYGKAISNPVAVVVK